MNANEIAAGLMLWVLHAAGLSNAALLQEDYNWTLYSFADCIKTMCSLKHLSFQRRSPIKIQRWVPWTLFIKHCTVRLIKGSYFFHFTVIGNLEKELEKRNLYKSCIYVYRPVSVADLRGGGGVTAILGSAPEYTCICAFIEVV